MPEQVLPIAHAAQNPDGSWRRPHDLAEHLTGVAALAARNASKFGAEHWGRIAGLWHDLGKYRPRFQNYIRRASGFEADAHIKGEAGRAPHSTAGALLAEQLFGKHGRVLAYLIAGHHAGLHDWHSDNSSLQHRLQLSESRAELEEAIAAGPPAGVLSTGDFRPDLRVIPGGPTQEELNPLGFALWVRMLFSCLVDADFLDTERYMNPEQADLRGDWPTLIALRERFSLHMDELAEQAGDTLVNRLRAKILAQCRGKALEVPGLFSLTVPTGGGKTLSSMAFALEHAQAFNKRRVIYVIPYTSIIEQTADVFRSIFGDAVVEHHSNAEATPEKETLQSRLASENWDAPIVVTTSVQFFESLFAAKTSRCRKLHNLVDSIVVLDEAQLLPPEFLQPILDATNLLSKYYGVTVVLSTATQPALSTREYFDPRQSLRGLDNVREIIDDPDALYRALERVAVRLPADWHATVDWDTLAAELAGHGSVLAIVNRRRDARELWQRMPRGCLHLSALMCGAHRSDLIGVVKERLASGEPTRVVSTQLVEAGVDVDFPVVYRALAGLDSIAQAAGRCNREGRLPKGEVVVFVPPSGRLPELIKKGGDTSISVLHGRSGNALTRERFSAYFERFYFACELDAQKIGKLLEVDGRELAVNFRTAAERFRLISDDDRVPVIVLYRGLGGTDRTVDQWLAMLAREGPQRWLLRKLQRYAVNVHRRVAEQLRMQGDIDEVMPGLFVQVSSWLYHPDLGLNPDGSPPTSTSTIA